MLRRSSVVLVPAALALALPLGASPATAKTLKATVGPGATITLKNAAGRRVTTLTAGTYTIVVDDRSSEHNFRLAGPGLNKSTGLSFTGKKTWRNVRLARGKTYTYLCDPHADHMRGSVRAR
jgi:plastocyanin